MAFEELKERQSAAWGAAPFERVAENAGDAHDDVVGRLRPGPGIRWLDVATGTGAVAIRAARAGAEVTGVDFAPALIETAIRLAEEESLPIRYDVGDAEDLPYGNSSFAVVSSTFGVMFAPDHGRAAAELARVCEPGGRLGLATWPPEGAIGEYFRLIAEFAPPPPEEAGVPVDWGRKGHVQDLLGDAFELEFAEGTTVQEGESGEQLWELFVTSFGPLKVLAESLEPARRQELHDAVVDYYEGYRLDGGIRWARTYLVTLGTRR